MSKRKKIFHKPDTNIPSEEDIFNYLQEDSSYKESNDEINYKAQSPSKASLSMSDAPMGGSSEKKKQKQTDKKKYELEKAMLSDPLISDAVEGYALLKDKEKSRALINDINKNIYHQTKRKNSEFPILRIASIVIIIFLISGSSLFIYNQFSNNEIAVSNSNEKSPAVPGLKNKSNDSATAVSVDSSAQLAMESEEKKQETKDVLNIPNAKPIHSEGFIEGNPSRTMIDEEVMNGGNTGSKENDFELDDKKYEKADLSNKKEERVYPQYRSMEQADSSTIISKDQLAIVTNSEEIRKHSDVKINKSKKEKSETFKRYKQRGNSYAPMISSDAKADKQLSDDNKPSGPSEKNATTEDGINFYNESKYSEASIVFKNIIKSNASDYTAQWYLALTYLKMDKKKDAVKLLKELSKPGNPYSDRASSELKKIN